MEEGHNYLKEIEEEIKAKASTKLYKESSFKGNSTKAMEAYSRADMIEDISDSSDDEEEKDAVMESEDKIGDMPMPKSVFSKPAPKFTGQVKATLPMHPNKPASGSKISKSYEPISWEEVFDDREIIDGIIPVYYSGEVGPVIFCIHGAGLSALSFGPFAKACKPFARVVSFDIRGHGGHHLDDDCNMPVDLLIQEAEAVLKHVVDKYEDASIIICGHSLGGALAAKLAHKILHPEEGKESEIDSHHIVGLFIIDVAEGSAISALPFMEQIVESRPKEFKSISDAIKYGVVSGQVKNLDSARVTMPTLVVEKDGKILWNTNLLASKDNWREWFTGMNKCFLESNVPKTLVIASNDRMDKELTIAQMQGKFKLVSMTDVGHAIHEDAPIDLAAQFKDFITVFKIKAKYNEKIVIISSTGKEIIIEH